jgi:hypothetical protein
MTNETAVVGSEGLRYSSTNYTLILNGWSGGAEWGFPAPGTGAWHHVLWTYDVTSISNVPVAYLDGATQTVTPVVSPTGTYTAQNDPWFVGNRGDGIRNWDGVLAWATIWDGVLLNIQEAQNLARGVMPYRVRPASVKMCLPLWGLASPEIDLITANGTATVTGTARQNDPPTTLFTAKTPFFMPPTPLISVPSVLSYNVM